MSKQFYIKQISQIKYIFNAKNNSTSNNSVQHEHTVQM